MEEKYKLTHTGPQVDAAVTAALTPDIVPTDGSQKLITSGAVRGSVAVLSPLTMLPNRNLLDNWDFRNPVNQRGQTSYTSAGHTVDRWKINGGVLSLVDGGVKLTSDFVLNQASENGFDSSKTYTASYMDISGIVHSVQAVFDHYVQIDSNIQFYIDSTTAYFLSLNSDNIISKVKLELGTVSTLANDPPADHEAENAKCKRYFNLWASDAARTAALQEVGAMRTAPVLSTLTISGTNYYTASADL